MASGTQEVLVLAKKLYFEATAQKTISLPLYPKWGFSNLPHQPRGESVIPKSRGGSSFTFCSSMSLVAEEDHILA